MELRMDEFEELKCGVYALSCSSRARAELIVNAVNSHEAMVEALEEAKRYINGCLMPGYSDDEMVLMGQIEEALAAAKGGSHD